MALDAGQRKEQFRDGQEETLQDTEMMEDLGSEEEVNSVMLNINTLLIGFITIIFVH